MPKRTLTHDCYDYDKFRDNVDFCISTGAILNQHLTRFTKGSEIDLLVRQFLKQKKCIVVLRDNEGTGKLVGVVVTNDDKNIYGVNVGTVVEVLYDRDNRTFKKHLNKVKSVLSGIKTKGYVDSFTQSRAAY